MVFEGLSEKLQNVLKKLKGKGKLSEKDVRSAMREVKLALLEADVSFLVVKDFINKITNRAVGHEVMESLTPGQQVIKIVNEELTLLMGETHSKINFSDKPPTVILMVGLQGSGKTTTAGKIGLYLKGQGKNPLMAACDIYRPAAIKQLEIVGDRISVPVFSMGNKQNPVKIAKLAVKKAQADNNDVVIIDTAGRLHVDETLMEELINIKSSVKAHETLLVVDAMTGQDAVNAAKVFNEKLKLTGVVLTKLDSDTRGGAALSIREVAQCPIKFAGMGEKLQDLESFHPDRMASRILGMGDVLTLIEKAQTSIDEKKVAELQKKLLKEQFTFDDFMEQLQQMKNIGSMSDIMKMIPGAASNKLKDIQVDDNQLVKIEAIISSMTKNERVNPDIINGSRRRRIAAGSGTRVQDVNKLIKQFDHTKKMLKQFSGMEKSIKRGNMKFPFF